jgi:HEAT repeat protein
MVSGIPRLQAFSVVEHVLRHGNTGGRRQAAAALAEFQGADANALALKALEDPDPHVQATAALQVRSRGIPGAMGRLLELAESRHGVVRRAVRESLAEFSFPRFLATFDMLEDEARRNTGMLVKKIDPETVPRLADELTSKMRTRRLRGLDIARTIDAVDPLETEILGLLEDEDHMLRAGAAAALARGSSQAGLRALEAALKDTSPRVRETAEESLRERARFRQWRETLSDPRD